MEGYGPSTYGDGFADVYDEWYHDVGDPDAAVAAIAAVTAAAGGGAVLELGVGSGRLAVPLAATGIAVWGIDGSEAMLPKLAEATAATDAGGAGGRRGATVRAVHGDMADLDGALGEAGAPRFAAVVAAFNTFFLLADEAAQQACLAGVARWLAPGGRLLLEAYVPADPPTNGEAEAVLEPRRVELDRVVFTISVHRPMEQVVQGQHVELKESGIRLRPWMLRYATPAQLDGLAASVGLHLQERWGGWDHRPFDGRSAVHVSVYGAG